jgi:hypothetical protein
MAAELFTSEEGYHHRLDRDNYTNIPFDIHITIYNETKGDGFLSLKLSFFELRGPFQSFNVFGFIDDTTDQRVVLSRFVICGEAEYCPICIRFKTDAKHPKHCPMRIKLF